jgi:protein-S-isoprenylcysteine O-methyltransferase Ste14
LSLIGGALRPGAPPRRVLLAYGYGVACHALFALAVLAMIVALFFGMSESLGRVPEPWRWWVNAALLLQFPLTHSALLSSPGRRVLTRLAPGDMGGTLSTTTYALIASVQLFALFALWTPSGTIWWRAEGVVFWAICAAFAVSWLLLLKASWDAGAEVQSGALGWMSLAAGWRPVFPDMPTGGLFRLIRQPIYLSFALTLWTVPVWTPDQLTVAFVLTAYCLAAPVLKERRFSALYGARFAAYRAATPYMLPRLTKERDDARHRAQ